MQGRCGEAEERRADKGEREPRRHGESHRQAWREKREKMRKDGEED